MKILVTGATGFIGKRLSLRLLEEGDAELYCARRRGSDLSGLEDASVRKVLLDVTDRENVAEVMGRIKPDMVFHCAAKVMSRESEELMRVNAAGTLNVCRSCLDSGTSRLVHLSSVAVISGNTGGELNDEMGYRATGDYGISKIEAERTVVSYRNKGLRASIIRPCMVYGENEPHMLGKLIHLASKRLLPLPKIKEMGSLLQLAHIDNVVQALMLARKGEKALGGTFIVADRAVITLADFFLSLYSYSAGRSPLTVPGPVAKIMLALPGVNRLKSYFKDRTYDITRAEKALGYDPRISTSEGLENVIRAWPWGAELKPGKGE